MSGSRISSIGIPRAFYYYQYPLLWETYFSALGIEPVLSPPASASTVAAAAPFTEAEHCLAHKIFDGQLVDLASRAQALFIPRILSMTRRHICCAKFGALPDASRALLKGPGLGCPAGPLVLSPEINENKRPLFKTLRDFALELGADKKTARNAAGTALETMKRARRTRLENARALPLQGRFLLLGHPYTVEDPFIARGIRNKLAEFPLEIMTFEGEDPPASFIRWCTFNRIYHKLLAMNTASYRAVIQVSTFNCGPDSVCADIFRRLCLDRGLPYLELKVDEHTGFVGIETRLEAFADSLEWLPQGEPQ
ncbi:MAG: acyl-CoA dehydratase activase-related protein [Spirochaetaceae bacterium]|jgi:predicted nucleotide-binding protein (sugar kinase/HSP70/actin superfamily)|nr:acyl-CoA dehydratase activase-related protein [Spirochaetaceae bacterium]